MRSRLTVASLALILALSTSGCDSGGGGDVGPIILITNQWWEEGNPDHQFQFNSPDDFRTEGAFSGEEALPRENFTEFNELVGFWTNGRIQFTVERPDGDVRYVGTFEEENQTRLEFTSPAGDLVIVRDDG